MNWTMSEFFSNGGTTKFVDRLAASLGVPSYRVKVVSVYEGSVVVDFNIEQEPVAATKKDANGNVVAKTADEIKAEQAKATAALASVKTVLVQQADSGTLNVGAPVMGLAAVEESSGEMKLQSGTPIPAAPTTNPTIAVSAADAQSMVPGNGALGMGATLITLLALIASLF